MTKFYQLITLYVYIGAYVIDYCDANDYELREHFWIFH